MTDAHPAGGDGLWQAPGGDLWRDLIPDIDERAARKRVDCSAVDEEVRAMFMDQVREALADLRTSIAAGDAMAVRRVAHMLQGTGGAVGVPEITILGEALSAAARAADWGRCADLAARLRRWHVLNGGEASGAP